MTAPQADSSATDFTQGVLLTDLPAEGALPGRVGDDPVLVSRQKEGIVAVSAICTHYGAPLVQGLISDGVVRCPWHHACFDLQTGVALHAPAFDPLDTWRVEISGDRFFVRERLRPQSVPALSVARPGHPNRILIVGGGGAGFAAAEMLRRLGYVDALTMLSADSTLPCDRPNLSKDFLAGKAPEDWVSLKDRKFYQDREIDLRLGVEAMTINTRVREVITVSGERYPFDALLLATGAEPVRLSGPGFDRPNVHTLRSLDDARAIIAAAAKASRVAVVGASFIGLEVAASMRARGLEVHVIAPDSVPMERVLGRDIGLFVRALHEQNGVQFYLGRTTERFDGRRLTLAGGGDLEVDFVVLGVGVKPRTALAASAGLAVDKGVIVDRHLETSVKDIFAAGDIARYPDKRDELIRVEHWVVAERQGQVAAANLLGGRETFDAPPFFWSNHYGHAIRYVGHAPTWDSIEMDGSAAAGDCTARYYRDGQLLAVASIGRDFENLQLERAIEHLWDRVQSEPAPRSH